MATLAPVAPRLLRVRDAAAYMGVSESCMRKWIQRGVLAGCKIEGVLRIDLRDIEQLIEKHRFLRPPS